MMDVTKMNEGELSDKIAAHRPTSKDNESRVCVSSVVRCLELIWSRMTRLKQGKTKTVIKIKTITLNSKTMKI